MPTPALLVLVRHAESTRNVAKKGNVFFADDESRAAVRGIPDFKTPLTEEGHRQARETGVGLREKFGAFDQIYHSGYLRTVETTQSILTAYPESDRQKMPISHELYIRERESGYAFDMTFGEAKAAFPWLEEYWKTTGPFFGQPPGGESVAQVCERVEMFLNNLNQTQAGKKVLVVTHGITLRAFRFLLEHWTYEEAIFHMRHDPPQNCGVIHYEVDSAKQELALKAYNVTYWGPISLWLFRCQSCGGAELWA